LEFAGYRVLKSAVIYGANGSGKSNLIDAISFVTNNIRYAYGFTLNNMLVTNEYLYYFPNARASKIFEREAEDFTVVSKFKGKFSACKDVLKPNRLLLSCAANFSSVEEIERVFRFFSDELVIYSTRNQDNWMHYSLYQMNSDPKMKNAVITFMQGLGMGIKDIVVTIDQKKLESLELPPYLTDEFKNMLLQQNVDAITANVVYEKFSTDLMMEESVGVRKLFALLCPLLDIMVNGKVLICDELESGLHEALLFGLIKLFTNTTGQKFPQLFLQRTKQDF
jgi:hypothetical protein